MNGDRNSANFENVTAKNVVGRDQKNVTNIIYNTIFIDENLKRLIREHEASKETSPEYREFCAELNKFFNKKNPTKIRNLQEKLSAGERDSIIEDAMEAKDYAVKKITKYTHYQTAQEIFTYLLTNMKTTYVHEIYPKIKSKKYESYEIDDLIHSKIIEPTLVSTSQCSICIDKTTIYGLLYLLTGNCYIEWE
ncbi:MAG: ABC-three component system protein [Desulfomicrobium sp.]